MKKRVVAKAQKRTRRNIIKQNDKLKSRIHRITEAKKEQKFTKKPNRSLRRLWNRAIGKADADCPARVMKDKK